jgi:hypothetical protein
MIGDVEGHGRVDLIWNELGHKNRTYVGLAKVLACTEKSIFLCDYLPSQETQHEVHEGLNVVENSNATNDFICYGRQGELATNSREQQEIVTFSLQLLQNCLMLINTILVEQTIEREGLWERLSAEDLPALTPLFHGHINPYGQLPSTSTVRHFSRLPDRPPPSKWTHLTLAGAQFYCPLSQRPSRWPFLKESSVRPKASSDSKKILDQLITRLENLRLRGRYFRVKLGYV